MRKSRNSVLLLELQMMTILFTMSDFTWFLAGDIGLFVLVFIFYFIPSMYSINVVVSDHEKFEGIIKSKLARKILIMSLLMIGLGIIYNLIYSFDWLISGYASSMSATGLMVASIIIYLIAMDVSISKVTIQKVVTAYSIVFVAIIPIFLMIIWYYSQYDIIEINKVSNRIQPLYVYLMMLSGVPLLLFFDTSSKYFGFFKRAIFSIIIICIVIFGVLAIIGSAMFDPSAPSIFDSVYDKMEYVFADFHPEKVIAFIATMNIIHFGFMLILTTYGIKNMLVSNYEYVENKHRTYEVDYEKYVAAKKRKTLFTFIIIIVIIEFLGYFSAINGSDFTGKITIIGIMSINLVLSIAAIKIKRNIVTIINSQIVIGITLVGLLSIF